MIERHKRTVRALGLRRLNQTVVHDDSIRVDSVLLLLRAPRYPPPRGRGVSMKEAEISYGIVRDAGLRENAN